MDATLSVPPLLTGDSKATVSETYTPIVEGGAQFSVGSIPSDIIAVSVCQLHRELLEG